MKFTRTNIIVLLTFVIAIIIFLLIYSVNKASNTIIDNKKIMLLNEAKEHFNNIVMLSIKHGGVYLKEYSGLKASPYLTDSIIKTQEGENLVKVDPTWIVKHISKLTNAKSEYYFKITSLNPINPNNKALDFELEGLKYLQKNKSEKYYYKFSDNLNKFNFIGRLNVEKECIQCHAEQNYVPGELRGGIRVSIPIDSVISSIKQIKEEKFYFSLLIATLGVFVWGLFFYLLEKIFKQQEELKKVNTALKKKVQEVVNKNTQKEIQLNNQSKLVAMGEMIGNIAHQWRQPLSVISTGATGLKMQKSYGVLEDKSFYETVDIINDNAQYLSQTIDDFKNFIKGDKEAVEFSLKKDIDSFLKIIDSSIKSHQINIVLSLDEDIIFKGFPNELIQCFINIYNNSKDAFLDNAIDMSNRHFFINQYRHKNNIVIVFKDNAGGIPKNLISKVFDAYFTTKGEKNGTGLGLHMTSDIIKGMDGNIKVSNDKFIYDKKEYIGAKFTITLPLEVSEKT